MSKRTPTHDTVYYHKGGKWHPTLIGPHEVKSTLAALHKAGYHAVPGRRSIGAPSGPPRTAARARGRKLSPHAKF